MVLLIDNYDSFAYNLARYMRRLGQEVEVRRNDAIDVEGVRRLEPQAIVLSPGPCTPNEAGCSLELVRALHSELPILGVCLGHQTIAAAFGAHVVRANAPMHGRTTEIKHSQLGLFAEVPTPFTVCRYHSLAVDPTTLPDELQVTATTCDDGTIMGLQHTSLPVFGLQFHPEAILTEHGYKLLQNFLTIVGLADSSADLSIAATELRRPSLPDFNSPNRPVTF